MNIYQRQRNICLLHLGPVQTPFSHIRESSFPFELHVNVQIVKGGRSPQKTISKGTALPSDRLLQCRNSALGRSENRQGWNDPKGWKTNTYMFIPVKSFLFGGGGIFWFTDVLHYNIRRFITVLYVRVSGGRLGKSRESRTVIPHEQW